MKFLKRQLAKAWEVLLIWIVCGLWKLFELWCGEAFEPTEEEIEAVEKRLAAERRERQAARNRTSNKRRPAFRRQSRIEFVNSQMEIKN